MRKEIFVLVWTVAAMAALAQDKPDRPDPIIVKVVNGQVIVLEDPAVTEEGHGGLIWDMGTDGYGFAQDGIVINSDDWKGCGLVPRSNSTRFHCGKVRHKHGARYKYTVKVIDSNLKPLPQLDPVILNH